MNDKFLTCSELIRASSNLVKKCKIASVRLFEWSNECLKQERYKRISDKLKIKKQHGVYYRAEKDHERVQLHISRNTGKVTLFSMHFMNSIFTMKGVFFLVC